MKHSGNSRRRAADKMSNAASHRSSKLPGKAKKGYFKDQWNLFIGSFRNIKLSSVFIMLYDALFYVLLLSLFWIWNSFVGLISPKNLQNIQSISQQQLQALASTNAELQTFTVIFTISMVLLFLLSILAWVFSRALIWNRIMDKKLSLRYIWKYSILNVLWWIILAIVFGALLMAFMSVKTAVVIIIALTVLAYLLAILFFFATQFISIKFTVDSKLRVFSSIKAAFAFTFGKLGKIAVPALFLLLVFAVFNLLVFLAALLPESVSLSLSMIMLLVFMMWARYYSVSLLKDIESR